MAYKGLKVVFVHKSMQLNYLGLVEGCLFEENDFLSTFGLAELVGLSGSLQPDQTQISSTPGGKATDLPARLYPSRALPLE